MHHRDVIGEFTTSFWWSFDGSLPCLFFLLICLYRVNLYPNNLKESSYWMSHDIQIFSVGMVIKYDPWPGCPWRILSVGERQISTVPVLKNIWVS